MEVLVTGGTGAVGHLVVRGLREAVVGMGAIVHAGSATAELTRTRATDVGGTRRLLAAAQAEGVAHLVYISIVGMEGVAYPYYRAKLAADAIVREVPVPWTILRATRFHTLMEFFLAAFSRLPGVMTVPLAWRFQPVDPAEVAARLADAATGAPAGLLPDFGGPEVRSLGSLAESWRAARGVRKRLLNLPLPFRFSRQFAAGRLLCPDHRDGITTFEQYLARKYPASGWSPPVSEVR